MPRLVQSWGNGVWQANAPYTHFVLTEDCVDTWETATRPQENLGGLLGTPEPPAAPPLPVGLPGLVGSSASCSKIALKPISGNFAFLDGRSLVGNAGPVLLSILAIVAVSQGPWVEPCPTLCLCKLLLSGRVAEALL